MAPQPSSKKKPKSSTDTATATGVNDSSTGSLTTGVFVSNANTAALSSVTSSTISSSAGSTTTSSLAQSTTPSPALAGVSVSSSASTRLSTMQASTQTPTTSASAPTDPQAAETSSNSSTPTHTASPSPNGISIGALAGGIVGAAIAAALIAIVITFFCMRRDAGKKAPTERQQSRNRRSQRGTAYAGVSGSKSGCEKSPVQYDSHAWEQHLPQSLDDRTVQTSVKALFDQVQLHVENYYTTTDVKITQEVAASLSALQTPQLPEPITSVMGSSRSHLPVIKHCLAYMVSQGMSEGGDPTLLPPTYTAVSDMSGNKLNPAASRQAFSKWRVLTAYLQPDPLSTADNARAHDRSVSSMVETFSDAFYLWDSQPANETDARQHLVELLKNASNVSTMLFAQPSSYEFRWPTPRKEGGRRNSLLVVPAFEKVADEHCNILERPQNLMQAVVEHL